MSPTMTALLKRHQADGRMHVLCRIKAQSITGRSAECWLNAQPQIHKNGRQLSIVLIFNQAGLPLLNRSGLQGLRCALTAAGAGIFTWQDDVPDTVGTGPPPRLSATFRAAQRPPAAEPGTAARVDLLDDQQLAELYANMPLIVWIRNTPMPPAFTLMVARKMPQLREACMWKEGPARHSYSKAMTLSSALSCVRSLLRSRAH